VHARFPAFVLALFLGTVCTAVAAGDITGVIVDAAGHPVARAYVRAVDGASREIAATFADEFGRFHFAAIAEGCRILVSLTGFQPADVECGAQPLRIALGVAPIQETVVVTATRTEAPAAQVGASVSTFTADDLERRRAPRPARP